MIIAVGTKNAAKNAAVAETLSSHWREACFIPVDVASGVRAQPLSDTETLEGALNRARAALQAVPEATYGIGLEGGTHTIDKGMFLLGWVAMVHKDGRESFGGSPRIVLPRQLAEAVLRGEELGSFMDTLYGTRDKAISHANGAYGILTNDRITRTDQFKTALECAAAPFVNARAYDS
jgi:inosine/xanthosine triphosphatase